MLVYLDGRPQRFFPGATVRDLAGRLDPEDYEAWKNEDAYIVDENGFEVGSGGALCEGCRYWLRRRPRSHAGPARPGS